MTTVKVGCNRLRVLQFSANWEAAEKYVTEYEKLVADERFSPEQIYEAGKTTFEWRCVPCKTLAGAEKKVAYGIKSL